MCAEFILEVGSEDMAVPGDAPSDFQDAATVWKRRYEDLLQKHHQLQQKVRRLPDHTAGSGLWGRYVSGSAPL